MKHTDNYRLQVEGAKKYFLRYDQQALIEKLELRQDADYLYTEMLCTQYRIHRERGTVERLDDTWTETNSHSEVMTLLDLVCDSRPDRYPARRWQNMTNFGKVFHRSLMEDQPDAFAQAIQDNQAGFRRACMALRGQPGPGGDISFALPFFDSLNIAIQFWEGDEEFPPRVRWLWDENALMYLKYETMWFALGLLRSRILAEMEKAK
jgi:hypothetical protein